MTKHNSRKVNGTVYAIFETETAQTIFSMQPVYFVVNTETNKPVSVHSYLKHAREALRKLR